MEALKQILSNFPQGFVAGLLMNGSLIAIAYFIFWKKFKKRFQNWRIQLKERVNAKQIKAELKNSVFTLMVGALFSSIVIYLSSKGYTKIYTNFSDHSPFFAIAGFFIFWRGDSLKVDAPLLPECICKLAGSRLQCIDLSFMQPHGWRRGLSLAQVNLGMAAHSFLACVAIYCPCGVLLKPR